MYSNVKTAPWMADSLRQGFEFLAAGELELASECCRRLLGAQRDLVEAHFLVGLIAVELKQTWTAVSAFGSITTIQKEHGAAWAHLSKLFMSAGQPNRADAALEQAVRYHDGNPAVLELIGSVHGLLGDQVEATDWFSRALAGDPSSIPFAVNLANSYMFLGKIDKAEELIRDVLQRQPGNPNANWVLANLRKATTREHVEKLQKYIVQNNRSPRALAYISYALGKELEDLGEWDEAFAAFSRGAIARRSVIDFDESTESAMYDAFASTFTAEWLAQKTAGHGDNSPIFIVGQPRTGTTLVERIVTSHSDVHSAGELGQFSNCVRRLANYQLPERISPKLAAMAAQLDDNELGKNYLLTTTQFRGDLPRFVDKLPSNYLYIPLILSALPNAKIIHVRRNPMDACFSSFKQLFADAYPHSYDQEEMARHHARYYRLMSCWRREFPGRFLEVRYEEVAGDLELNARKIIEYLELPWQQDCLEFYKQKSAVTTASTVQVRQPAHTKSIGRWLRYEKQLKPMRNALLAEGVPVEK